MQVEVWKVGADDCGEHAVHGFTLLKRSAEPSSNSADKGSLCRVEIAEVIDVASRRDEQVSDVGGGIIFQWGNVEREDEVVINDSTARDLDVPGDLTAYEAANLGHALECSQERWLSAVTVLAVEPADVTSSKNVVL